MDIKDTLRVLATSDLPEKEELAEEIQEAFQRKIDGEIKDCINDAAARLHEALISGEEKNIRCAILKFRRAANSVTETSVLPKLPHPPALTTEMIRELRKICNGKLPPSDGKRRKFFVNGIQYEDAPRLLIQRVKHALFGLAGKMSFASRYIEQIESGKNHEEAFSSVSEKIEQAGSSLPAPPDLTPLMCTTFLSACGRKISSRDSKKRNFSVSGKDFCESPSALIQRIGQRIWKNKGEAYKSIKYVEYIAMQFSHEDALRKINDLENNKILTLPDPLNLTPAIAQEFLTACKPIRVQDTRRYTINIQRKKYQDSPSAYCRRISLAVWGDFIHWGRRGVSYIKGIATGKTHEAVKKSIDREEKKHEKQKDKLLPAPPAFTSSMAKALLNACNGNLYDAQKKIIKDGENVYYDSARRFLSQVGHALWRDWTISKKCVHFVECLAAGYSFEEAKLLADLGEEGREDVEFEQFSQLKLEEVVAFFRNQPGGEMKLKLYLQFAHKELSDEEINRIVIRSFKGLHGSGPSQLDQYLQWKPKLPDVEIISKIPAKTGEKIATLTGRASGSDCVYIYGTWRRRVPVAPDGTFTVTIPLAIGKTNEIMWLALHREKNLRSDTSKGITVQQTDKPDDVAALVKLLEQLGASLTKQIAEDPGRQEFLAECMERTLIKKFSKSFEEGEQYVSRLLETTKHPALRRIIKQVLNNFEWIDAAQLPNVQEGSLMFFQKYCAYKIRQAIDSGKNGINLCNDPGLGKTRTVWAVVADRKAAIFTPNSVVGAWREEADASLEQTDLLVLHESGHMQRKETLRRNHHKRIVTNVQYLRNIEDKERFQLISDEQTIVVHDEAHSRKNEHSEQSKGARMLKHKFVINVTATLARNPVELRRMLHTLDPGRSEFRSDEAFRKAFPSNDPAALKQLKLIVDQYTLRFRKYEVMEEINPELPLEEQLHCLPKKEHISPGVLGKFETTEKQAQAVYEMFLDWPTWCRRNGKYIPKDKIHEEDGLRTKHGFAKMHAYRQTINNPSFINDRSGEDPKTEQMKRIVHKCIRDGRKVVLFCMYEAQAQKYAEIFEGYQPVLYIGQTSRQGYVRNPLTNKPKLFSLKEGLPIEDSNGEPMLVLDYERHMFQYIPERKILIATYAAGSVGSTFTAGKATIYDDLPSDCKEDIQAEDRTHRIDASHQTHAAVQYYQMQALYPTRFLERMKKKWVRKQEGGTWEEYEGSGRPPEEEHDDEEEQKNPWQTAYQAFFEQGTYDQVQSKNLQTQRVMFHLINDGIADENTLHQEDAKFIGLENGNGD